VAANLERYLRANNRDGRRTTPATEALDRDARRPRLGGAREPADLPADVRAAIARLPRTLRRLAVRLMEGHTVAAIARAQGRPRTTGYADLRRLRQRFEDAGLRDYLRD